MIQNRDNDAYTAARKAQKQALDKLLAQFRALRLWTRMQEDVMHVLAHQLTKLRFAEYLLDEIDRNDGETDGA